MRVQAFDSMNRSAEAELLRKERELRRELSVNHKLEWVIAEVITPEQLRTKWVEFMQVNSHT